MRKRNKHSENEGKEASHSNMMTVVALTTVVFISRYMKKNNLTEKLQEFATTPSVFYKNWQKPLKKIFNVVFSET